MLSYVLVTPARNEASFIELTIRSVVEQTIRPFKWVIVSDGSTDGTDDIVKRYVSDHPWIELVRMPERRERHFAGKVQAFNAGYALMKWLQYDVIGNLDADISFDSNYFQFLLEKISKDSRLGLVGTPFREHASADIYDYRFANIDYVSGACQLFRRECFEEIGGYVPLEGGGIDHLAVLTARMRGWKTRTFTDKVCLHHREMGTAQFTSLTARFRQGEKDYAFGYHPLWELFRAFYQMTKQPFLIGGTVLGSGYLWALIRHSKRSISPEVVAFQRKEQMVRLRRSILRWVPSQRAQPAA